MKIPPGTSAGTPLRLTGRGLPKPHDQGAGDLYAVVQIVVPKHASDTEKALYEKLREGSRFDPRAHFPRNTQGHGKH